MMSSVRLTAARCVTLLIVLFPAADASGQGKAHVAVLNESNWDELAPTGKEADAIYGDIVLVNEHLRAVVAQPRQTRHANMTVRNVGGCLIDFSSVDGESDQLGAFYPGGKAFVFSDEFLMTADDEPVGKSGHGGAVSVIVRSAGNDQRPEYTVTYSLEADSPYLRVTSHWTNTTATDLMPTFGDSLRFDTGSERAVRQPNGIHSFYWMHDRHWKQACALVPDELTVSCNSGARDVVLKYESPEAANTTLPAGAELSMSRVMFAAPHSTDVIALAEAYLSVSDQAHGDHLASFVNTEVVRVVDADGVPVEKAVVDVIREGQGVGTFTTDEAGQARVSLQPVSHTFVVRVLEREVPAAETLVTPTKPGAPVEIALTGLHRGRVVADIRDGDGQPIPAKVEFIGRDGTPTPDFGPESAEQFVRNLAYTPNGAFIQRIPAGDYDIIVSHGPEYDADFTQLTVPAGGGDVTLKSVLKRVVKTPGWVSADFHSHSSPSGDNTGSQVGRVLNLAAEQIEFGPCTEHNRIDTYTAHIERFSLQPFLATVSGMELTGQPLPLNHQNVFPLIHKPRTQDGGGPVTDTSVETQIERVAFWDDRSEKLVQQNHPDIGWLFYDQNGDGIPDSGYSRAFDLMHVMEIHPIDRMLRRERFDVRDGVAVQNNKMLNWLQLLNQGHRIWGVVNTDAHYNYHGSSSLRNWIRSSTDDPGQIDPMELVRASKSGHTIMSNGPFLDFQVTSRASGSTVICGQDLDAEQGAVDVKVRVQCPNWLNIDTVFVLVNGRKVDECAFDRGNHPDLFDDGTTQFDRTISLTLDEDAHLIAVAGHSAEKLGPVVGPFWGERHPTAVSNPVFVDVDGGGFQPNRDTLGHPLPVKFDATKR